MASVAVVGLGLMGGSLGLALREAGWSVSGLDRDPEAAAEAVRRGAVQRTLGSLGEVVESDLVVLAAPVPALRDLLRKLPAGVLATDLASTKVAVLEWAEEAGANLVGGHPLCGSERSGIAAARPGLYSGAIWALTRSQPLVEEMVAAVGATPFIVPADEHDRLVAGGSHAAFVISAAYMLAMAESDDWPDVSRLTSTGFADMTRLAGGDPEMYAGIAATNAANLRDRLRQFQAALERLLNHLDGDPDELRRLFEEARQARRGWEEGRRT